MVASILLAALALRSGLALRRGRLGRAPRTPRQRSLHLRLAKPAVALVLVGFAAGPPSAVWLRGWDAFASFHGAVGLVAATFFAAAALLGHRMEEGRGRHHDAHALLGILAFLAAAVAAVAGFVLLP